MVVPRIRPLLALMAVVLALGCNGAPSEGPAAAAPAPSKPPTSMVKTVAPEYRVRASALATTGRVQFDEETLVRVQAPLTGRVLEVLARPGDVVEAGQRLLVMFIFILLFSAFQAVSDALLNPLEHVGAEVEPA